MTCNTKTEFAHPAGASGEEIYVNSISVFVFKVQIFQEISACLLSFPPEFWSI